MRTWTLWLTGTVIVGLFCVGTARVEAQEKTPSLRREATPPLPSEGVIPVQAPAPTLIIPGDSTPTPAIFSPKKPRELPGESPRNHGPSAPFSTRIGLDLYDEPEPEAFEFFHRSQAVRAPSHIDQAVPVDVFRFRVDPQYRMNHPDRAELFWPKNGVFTYFGEHDNAKGPVEAESRVDAVDVSFYAEAMLSYNVSVWTNVPFRSLNPSINKNEAGIGDVSAGLKWAFILDPHRAVSLQVAGIFPSGEGIRGLGTENYGVQPGLMWQEALTENLTLYVDVHDRIPVNPRSDFTGHVLRYGVGLSYLFELGNVRVMPLAEVVGWSVLSGKQSFELGKIEPLMQSARGMTIFDTYYGMRFSLADDTNAGSLLAMSDLFASYGVTTTANWWFRDQWRLEYRVRF